MTENVRLQRMYDFTIMIRDAEDSIKGTGIIVPPDGKILTCAHVIKAALGMHPRDAIGQEIHVYFPQVDDSEEKARIAIIDGCFQQHDDDVVLLRLKDGPSPLGPERIAKLGEANGSEGNEFQSYGFSPIGDKISRYASGKIEGPVEIDLPADTKLHSKLVQLTTNGIRSGMSGGPVLDKKRNLVIGIVTERWNSHGKSEEENIAWATDNLALTFNPINLPLLSGSFPMGPASQPKVNIEATKQAAAPQQKYSCNNAQPSLKEWVGREELLKDITDDWINSKKRVTGLVGFGGEGKSVLARRWIDDLLKNKALPQPEGIFWWGFSDRPNTDAFFKAAFNYLSSGNADLARRYPSSSAKSHFVAGILHGGRYLFILDGLEVMQHQEGDRFGMLISNDLREFLQFFAAPNHDSFCIITSRVPILDLMEYTTYCHREVGGLSASDGRNLLKELGIKGSEEELDRVVADWEGHPLTLSLLASYLKDHQECDIMKIGNIPSMEDEETHYERIRTILELYDKHLTKAEREILKIFSAFRKNVDPIVFNKIFRFESIDTPEIVKRLVTYRLLREVNGQYSIHPLIRAYYADLLQCEDINQFLEVHHQIKNYYLTGPQNMLSRPTLTELEPIIEGFIMLAFVVNTMKPERYTAITLINIINFTLQEYSMHGRPNYQLCMIFGRVCNSMKKSIC